MEAKVEHAIEDAAAPQVKQRGTRFWLGLVLVAALAAYANSFDNAFHFDDFHTVVDNPAIRSLKNVPRFFTDATTFSVLPANRTYRPFVSTSLAVDYMLGRGYVPLWFHVGTFLLFLVLILLLARLNTLLLGKVAIDESRETLFWLGLGGAAWFGLHPAMAETINYVIQRGDVYCTLGCVAALYLFARYPQRRKTGLYLLPVCFALLSKPPAAVFPLLLFFYCAFFENESAGSPRWKRAAIAAVPSVVVTALLLWLQSAMTPKTFMPSMISAWDYRLTQPYVWARYCAALFLPLHLNVDSDLTPVSGLDGRALAGLVFLLGLVAAIVWAARRRRLYPVAYGLIWFVLTQLPTSAYPLSEVENDHRMFFSFPGLMLATAWAGWLVWRRYGARVRDVRAARTGLAAVLLVLLAAYAYGTHRRNAVWHDEESLWRDDAAKSPHNGRGLMIYGLTQMNKGAYSAALATFQEALRYTPNYPTLEINLGVVNGLMADGGDTSKAADAERHFLRAIHLTPGDDAPAAYYGRWLADHGRFGEAIYQLQRAVQLNPSRAFQRDILIGTLEREGDTAGAKQAAQEALAVIPDDAEAQNALTRPTANGAAYWINVSLAQSRNAQYVQSIDSARRALAIDPKSAEAYNNIGAAYGALQQWDEGIRNEQEALRLDPNLQIAQNNLKWFIEQKTHSGTPQTAFELLNKSFVLDQQGKYTESIATAKQALELDPHSAEAWNNIAAANEAIHRWDEAIVAAQRAIALKPDFQLAKNNLAWAESQKRLKIR